MTAHPVPVDDEDLDDLPEQLRIRREKYDRLVEAADGDPRRAVSRSVARTKSLAQVRAAFPDLDADAAHRHRRGHRRAGHLHPQLGKLCFATLREEGVELQAMLSADRVGIEGPGGLEAWKHDVDLGDLVFVHGEVITSKRGELSVLADRWQLAAKALRPLPVAHRPLSEETRVRQRYVDLIVRPEARQMVQTRAAVTRSLRETLHGRGYLEVETPILQTVHGGAAARPFHTHLNAFDLRDVAADRDRALPEALRRRRHRARSTRSAGRFVTRASTPRIRPSSRCSRPTRPTAITTRWPS